MLIINVRNVLLAILETYKRDFLSLNSYLDGTHLHKRTHNINDFTNEYCSEMIF